MTHVYFVRHAQPNYDNHDDRSRELTVKGLQDRKLATAYLAQQEVNLVLSSPYRRAIDTVRDFADLRKLPVVEIEDFRERTVDSVWIPDFNRFARQQWTDFNYKLTDGECLREVQERNVRALEETVARYAGQRMAVGSHGTALCTIINHYVPSFGFEGFQRVRGKMPWIVHFTFEGNECVGIEEHDLFTGESNVLLSQ